MDGGGQVGSGPVHEVLVLEDSRTHAIIVSRMLDVRSESAQAVFGTFRVTVTSTLAAALDHLAARRFAAVLVDLHVGDSTGLPTLTAVRRTAPDVPVLVLTGSDDEQVGVDAVAAGAASYLRKSEASPALLVRAIHHAVERQRLIGELERMAWFDELTGLHNRRGFFRAAAEAHAAAATRGDTVLAVFADLNDLKSLNDTCGHAAGDEAIAALAGAMAAAVPPGGVVGRLGGDELAALLPGAVDAVGFADRLATALAAVNHRRGIPVRVAVGCAVADAADTPLDEVLRAADADLYAAKARKAEVRGALVRSGS